MISGAQASRVSAELQERFGLSLRHGMETFDGEQFAVVRPTDLEEGNGFVVALARTPTQVEAIFRADTFAGGLIRKMWEADDHTRMTFASLMQQARADGSSVYVAVDGTTVENLPKTSEPWRRIEIDVSRRFASGKVTEDGIHSAALESASVCMSLATILLTLESTSESVGEHHHGLPEGAVVRIEVNKYERSPANRAACIAHYGTTCRACGFQFKSFYGDLGSGYIQVHHRVPVSQLGDGYYVNPVTDLVPVCANCHAMLHRAEPPMLVEELAALLERRALQKDALGGQSSAADDLP